MTLSSWAELAVALALTATLVWCAISDIRTRRIPNTAVLSVIGLYGIWACLHGGSGSMSGLAAATFALVVSFAMYVFKVWGAGDAKLFAALALFAGWKLLAGFAVATALAGGLVVLVRLVLDPRRAFLVWHMRRDLNDGRGVPYGVAIAIGALTILWGPRLGVLSPELLLAPAINPVLIDK